MTCTRISICACTCAPSGVISADPAQRRDRLLCHGEPNLLGIDGTIRSEESGDAIATPPAFPPPNPVSRPPTSYPHPCPLLHLHPSSRPAPPSPPPYLEMRGYACACQPSDHGRPAVFTLHASTPRAAPQSYSHNTHLLISMTLISGSSQPLPRLPPHLRPQSTSDCHPTSADNPNLSLYRAPTQYNPAGPPWESTAESGTWKRQLGTLYRKQSSRTVHIPWQQRSTRWALHVATGVWAWAYAYAQAYACAWAWAYA